MRCDDFPGCCGFKIIVGFGDVRTDGQIELNKKSIKHYLDSYTTTNGFYIALGHPDPENGKVHYAAKVHQFALEPALLELGFKRITPEVNNKNMADVSRIRGYVWIREKQIVKEEITDEFSRQKISEDIAE